MTEKSARNPTPGSFPHTGSALAEPRPPPVRGQRGATSAERGAAPGSARRGASGAGGGRRGGGRRWQRAPVGLCGGGGHGEGGSGRGSSPAAVLRQILESGSRWGAPHPPLRAPPRNTAQRRRGGPAESCGRRPAARPRAATSSPGESLPAVALLTSSRTPTPPRPRPAGSLLDRGLGGGGSQPADPAVRCAAGGRRGCARPEGLFTRAGGRQIRRRGDDDTPGLFAEGLGPVPPRRCPGGRRARWVSPRRGRFGDLR